MEEESIHRWTIFHLVLGLGMGGTEKTVELLSYGLRRLGFSIVVVGLYEGGLRADRLRASGIPVHLLYGNVSLLTELARSTGGPVGFHVHHEGGPDARWEPVFRALADTAAVFTVATNVFGQYNPSDEQRVTRIFHVSGVSFLLCRGRAGGVLSSRHWVVPNPVVLPRPALEIEKRELRDRIRRELGVSTDTVLCLRTASPDLGRWSNGYRALVSVAQRRSAVEMRFVFITAPEAHRRWLLRNGAFVLPTMPDEQLERYYGACDIMMHLSRVGESFGMSIGEAMARGMPVITMSTPGKENAQIELVDHMETGIVVSNVTAAAEAMFELAGNPGLRQRLGDAAIRRIREIADADAVARDVALHYAELFNDAALMAAAGEQQWRHIWSPAAVAQYREVYQSRLDNVLRSEAQTDKGVLQASDLLAIRMANLGDQCRRIPQGLKRRIRRLTGV